ncbi:hypothetical protein J7F02_34700 [Streptomyces sp. ISL-112]|uniref:hypothetical protein n=1 Tax=unclassified Streptomyces TaxID=2593676 RepID=UPI001BE5C97C|nr:MULTISPECIES: hypothetical protein [unclassified Streptomyces]MBT2430584.1 hypothetical protein [Streptomyces sp. ISL-112]MBT2465629.1 hypothetical protein [Streptomyces sp. ISL-63]
MPVDHKMDLVVEVTGESLGPAALLRCCRVWRCEARVSMAMPVRWQYAATSIEAMSSVSEASAARIRVIRFQSRARSGSL